SRGSPSIIAGRAPLSLPPSPWFNHQMLHRQETTMSAPSLSLPLIAPEPPPAPEWHGLVAAGPLDGAADRPAPEAPQGEHAPAPPAPRRARRPTCPRRAHERPGRIARARRRARRRLRRLPLRRRRDLPRPQEVLRPGRGRELHRRGAGRGRRLRPRPVAATAG